MSLKHIPVLLSEMLSIFDPRPSQTFLDGTVGQGGHAAAILEKTAPDGKLIGFDLDPAAVSWAEENLRKFGSERFKIFNSNFKEVKQKLNKFSGLNTFDGILLDLGVSSSELGSEHRGFSFQTTGPLDMRFSQQGKSAIDLLTHSPKIDLEKILNNFGEERYGREIAEEISKARKENRLKTTTDLADICQRVYAKKRARSRINPATKTFQAIRIAVNDELNSLTQALPPLVSMLKPGGKIIVISFHSLEDRIVKKFFQTESKDCVCPAEFPLCKCGHKKSLRILTKKPVIASAAERTKNPHSRSAKLRAAQKLKP